MRLELESGIWESGTWQIAPCAGAMAKRQGAAVVQDASRLTRRCRTSARSWTAAALCRFTKNPCAPKFQSLQSRASGRSQRESNLCDFKLLTLNLEFSGASQTASKPGRPKKYSPVKPVPHRHCRLKGDFLPEFLAV